MITSFEKLINYYIDAGIEIDILCFEKKYEFCYEYLIYKGYTGKDIIDLEIDFSVLSILDMCLLQDNIKKSVVDKYYLDASEVFDEAKEYSEQDYDLPMCFSKNIVNRVAYV